jgi:hypothetical protein
MYAKERTSQGMSKQARVLSRAVLNTNFRTVELREIQDHMNGVVGRGECAILPGAILSLPRHVPFQLNENRHIIILLSTINT